ncbi:Peptidyl-prolyl cis-trans isomerase FKBP53 [Linum grandiflorum]
MGFFGVEVKPEKPHPYHSDNAQGTLYVTQATLGLGSSKERSILQCSRGHNSPIFLCSLLPGKTESCSLHLEFKDELVAFSVVGKRSIHLTGYFVSEEGDYIGDEYDFNSGEDVFDTESDESSEFDFDDDDDDDDVEDEEEEEDDPAPKSGVLIEEITEDDKPGKGDGLSKKKKKKNQLADNEQKDRNKQIVVLESEDEDGFPVSTTVQDPQPETDESEELKTKKRKGKATEDNQPEKKKKKKLKQKGKKEAEADMDEDHQKELTGKTEPADANPASPAINGSERRETDADEPSKTKNKKKKKKNKKANADGEGAIATIPDKGNEPNSTLVSNEKQSASKARTFPNGLVIEELAMGKPDGKRASPGNQVSVQYIGKLQKNGAKFDSNIGDAPFKFRLGVGQVIKGWDVGIRGMRVGDKRRITIPPSMGYGEQGVDGRIPPNSWLVFDVELVNVR